MLEKYKFALSLVILLIATTAVFFPIEILVGVGGIAFLVACYRYPLFGLGSAIVATLLGEFARIELGGFSLLALDAITLLVVGVWVLRKLMKKESWKMEKVGNALLVFLGIAVLSLVVGMQHLTSGEFQFALLRLLRLLALSGMFFVAREIKPRGRDRLVNLLILVGGGLAVAGFYLFLLIPDFAEAGLVELGWDPHIGRLTSTWLDPNFAAGGFAFLLAFAGENPYNFIVKPFYTGKTI